jgi:hypothetical protein
MGVAIVEDWVLQSDSQEVLFESARFAEYLKLECPWVQLSLWLRGRDEPARVVMLRVLDRYSDYLHDRETEASVLFRDHLRGRMDSIAGPMAAEYDVCQSTGGTAKEIRFQSGVDWASSITAWRLRREGDSVEPMRAIAEYLRSLKRRRHSAVFSLWLRSRGDASRFLHVSTFKRPVSLELEAASEATRRLEQRLVPYVIGGAPEARFAGSVLLGGPTSLPRVALGRGWRPGTRRVAAQLGA